MSDIRHVVDTLRNEEQQLAAALDKVREAIAALTDATAPPAGRRRTKRAVKKAKTKGRGMTAAQREAVSRRMKAYWASRRTT